MGRLSGQAVTVLGAGVAGLAVARALALRGAEVTVLEQAPEIREFGAGLQITPNGVAVLRALGLGGALDAVAPRAQAVEMFDGLSGTRVARLDLARLRPDQGWHLMHRADLVGLLADGARDAGVQVRLLQKVESVDLSGPCPRVITATGAEMRPRILIGGDGLHSPARAALNGKVAPLFTHQIAWRATIPCTPDAPAVAEVHMGPGRHLVSYPLRGGAMRNIVAVEERIRWAEEGWNLKDDPLSLRVAFEKFGPRVRGWLDQVEDVWLWGLFRHPVAEHWGQVLPGDSSGAAMVAILGDAAHPTLPFLAQGANMALEDAWVLAEVLDGFGPGPEAVAAYTAARRERCTRIVAAATANARNYHLTGPMKALAHLGLRAASSVVPGSLLGRYGWVHDFDVTKAPLAMAG